MHISEGLLQIPAIGLGWGLAGLGVAWGIRKTPPELLPRAAVLGSAFFLASLVRVPFGATSLHFALIGLMGITLQAAAIPAIFIALLLQAVLFQFGGLGVLGANTVVMALPAVICGYVFGPLCRPGSGGASGNLSLRRARMRPAAFAAGFLGIGLAVALMLLFLQFSYTELEKSAWLIALSNLPLALAEGAVTLLAVEFLWRVAPDLLEHFNFEIIH